MKEHSNAKFCPDYEEKTLRSLQIFAFSIKTFETLWLKVNYCVWTDHMVIKKAWINIVCVAQSEDMIKN